MASRRYKEWQVSLRSRSTRCDRATPRSCPPPTPGKFRSTLLSYVNKSFHEISNTNFDTFKLLASTNWTCLSTLLRSWCTRDFCSLSRRHLASALLEQASTLKPQRKWPNTQPTKPTFMIKHRCDDKLTSDRRREQQTKCKKHVLDRFNFTLQYSTQSVSCFLYFPH